MAQTGRLLMTTLVAIQAAYALGPIHVPFPRLLSGHGHAVCTLCHNAFSWVADEEGARVTGEHATWCREAIDDGGAV